MLKRQRRDQKRPLFTAHGTPHLRTRSKPRWLAVRARQSCGSCAKIHLAPFSAHRVSRVVLSRDKLIVTGYRQRPPKSSQSICPREPCSCAVRCLGEVRLPISTPVRLFPAVGRWGSPRRCAHPHGDAHQQNHWRKKKSTLMGELSTATASRKPCSLQRKRRAFRVACTCFFWNNRESDNYSECPLVLLPQHPSRMHRKEYGRLPFSSRT
jgi:hypothetical protein